MNKLFKLKILNKVNPSYVNFIMASHNANGKLPSKVK